MKRVLLFLACLGLALPATGVRAQVNDNDYTRLGSRIRSKNQFPSELFPKFDPSKWSDAKKDNSKRMMHQFAYCLWHRSKEHSLAFLAQTDLGFTDFQQIGLTNDKAMRIFGFDDCLGQVAQKQNSGVMMNWTAPGIRVWLLQEAYFDKYPDKPDWVKPGYVVDERKLPLSQSNTGVTTVLNLADCVVAADPYDADLFFRTATGTPLEKETLNSLVPAIGPCLPQGLKMQIDPAALRIWLGEGLWHAAAHSSPAPAEPGKGSQ